MDNLEDFNFTDPRLLDAVRLLLGEEKPKHFIPPSENEENTEATRAVRVKINLRMKKKQRKLK